MEKWVLAEFFFIFGLGVLKAVLGDYLFDIADRLGSSVHVVLEGTTVGLYFEGHLNIVVILVDLVLHQVGQLGGLSCCG